MFHKFITAVAADELPACLNNPFYYSPHPLCVRAVAEIRASLLSNAAVAADAQSGKMFGVLVVVAPDGQVGYLAAFSGLLAGCNTVPGFVPPVFDLQSPNGYFKQEEERISAINNRIKEIEQGDRYVAAYTAVKTMRSAMEKELSAMREDMRICKQRRNELRAAGNLLPVDEAALVRESQFQKAELKRMTAKWQKKIAECEASVIPLQAEVDGLKKERKKRSAALQEWLFTSFKVLNGFGEERDLLSIFKEHCAALPPAGSGECAGPKLLQYAYLNGYRPLAMAEFWVGASPNGEVRRDGCYYGACKSKCEPILGFMLQGTDVEENALEEGGDISMVEVVYEDEYIVVVNKPSGVLSVPGIVGGESVQQWLRERCDSNDVYVVHRLDMATSGLLVAAKSMEVYKELQRQFAGREVRKQYTAILDGVPVNSEGVIELPLAADYANRPRQKVDYADGKSAVTRYKVIGTVERNGRSFAVVCFEPITGRTHQLRVHSAHKSGIDCPIVGDALYGTVAERLMLHASHITFVHPMSKETVVLSCESGFSSFFQ